ncbi:hypothetical protein [Streptomyces liangshanensis]|uniref:hypothetical protein n=1 Tax=Streptomyces liangshanensis TaxID=2717324 RepID=UPI0036DD5266
MTARGAGDGGPGGTVARSAALALTAVVSSLLLLGCAERPAGDERVHVPDAELRTEVSPGERETLYLAEQRLISTCMDKKGFRYYVVPPAALSASPMERPFGSDDVAWAEEHGYGISDGEQDRRNREESRPNPNGRYIASLSDARGRAFQRALDGTNPAAITVQVPSMGRVFTSADGCQADARARLYGDLGRWTAAKATVVNLRALVRPRLDKDPRYAGALASWRRCMARHGFPYDGPSDAVMAMRDARSAPGKPAPDQGPRAPHPRERATAVADARCNGESKLATVGEQVLRGQTREAARGTYREAAADYTTAVARALVTARDITSAK